MSAKSVCLDFDGVLNTYVGWRGPDVLYEPREGVAEFLTNLHELGYKIVIHTTRDRDKIHNWLVVHALRHLIDFISETKPPAICYVDDRGVCFTGDFDAVLEQIKTFKAFWEKNGE